MKIYPSYHRIEQSDRVQPKDIPISYIATDKVETDVRITKFKESTRAVEETPVLPYEPFKSRDAYLFDSLGKKIDASPMLQRIGELYYFTPKNAVEFEPKEISFSLTYKRDITFVNDKEYNFRIGCIDGVSNLSARLISIFGDAPRRGMAPLNISVNNQDMAKESLTNMSFEEADFLFIESRDGTKYGDDITSIDYKKLLSNHVNLWISIESLGEAVYENIGPFEKGGGAVYENTQYDLPGYGKAFDLMKVPEFLSDYEPQYWFAGESPILVLESPMEGFIIFSEKKLLESPGEHHKFIYEMISSVLLMGYAQSPQKTIWITDSIVDHIGMKESEYGYHHSKVYLNEMLGSDDIPTGEEFMLLDVKTSSNDVAFMGTDQSGVMLFQKINSKPDPKKEQGAVSVYTTKKTITLYKKEQVLKIEKDLEIKVKDKPSGKYLEISPYSSTSLMINTEEVQRISIPNGKSELIVSCKDDVFKLNKESDYDKVKHGEKLARVLIEERTEKEHFDTRVQGGGLPTGDKDDYNLLDISALQGRPYRKGGVVVAKLPKRLSPYKKTIERSMEEHVSSGDVPIVIFE